jgi:putative SbcD/Mre11-related phosphoesterase
MNLLPGTEIIEPYPALYIESIDTIIISDLHLGYEGVMAEYHGLFIPRTQFRKELAMLGKITEKQKASTLVITGDFKHEFSETTYIEFKEARAMFEFLKTMFKRIVVIKGNHDNYLFYITRKYEIELPDSLSLDSFLFIHGDVIPEQNELEKAEVIVMGHEHPAIALFDEVGAKEKIKAFLIGELNEKKLIVMPALSPLASGTEINLARREDLLSPVLKELVDMDKFKVIGIDEETGSLDFGELGRLRRI